MIDLYTAPTPNGWKVSVTLEELGLPYEVHSLELTEGDQRKPEFLKINPNGRIPAIVDRDNDDYALFESGAIMMYLAEKAGALLPEDQKERYQVIQWLMFQMGGVGPMQGQAIVFHRFFEERVQVAIDRYQKETRRLYEVLDTALEGKDYLAADQFTIADIANWSWIRTYEWAGVPVEGLDNLKKWLDRIEERPACQRGVAVPYLRTLDGDNEKFVKETRDKMVLR